MAKPRNGKLAAIIIEMKAQNATQRQIADAYGCSVSTVKTVSQTHGIKWGRRKRKQLPFSNSAAAPNPS
jgi:DNA invertase Pin-like site-specific DNA recombinase